MNRFKPERIGLKKTIKNEYSKYINFITQKEFRYSRNTIKNKIEIFV